MKATVTVILAALLPLGAAAQGFITDDPICYSWNGGHKSAGSFVQCHSWVIVQAVKPVQPSPPAPAPTIAPSPIMMPMQSCPPPPKPVLHKKRKPPVRC